MCLEEELSSIKNKYGLSDLDLEEIQFLTNSISIKESLINLSKMEEDSFKFSAFLEEYQLLKEIEELNLMEFVSKEIASDLFSYQELLMDLPFYTCVWDL